MRHVGVEMRCSGRRENDTKALGLKHPHEYEGGQKARMAKMAGDQGQRGDYGHLSLSLSLNSTFHVNKINHFKR